MVTILQRVTVTIFGGLYVSDDYNKMNLTDAPSESDPAISEARNRERTCQDVTGRSFFHTMRLFPIGQKKIYRKRTKYKYQNVFNQLFTRKNIQSTYKYTNLYRQIDIPFSTEISLRETVFACPLKYLTTKDIVFFYVTKEYNVGPLGLPYKPGRFIFANLRGQTNIFDAVILAEAPAQAYIPRSNFNVELYYLELREYIQLGT